MRLAMLYAITEDELGKLMEQPEEERFEYMMNELEEVLFDTPRGCELDRTWDAMQYCMGEGIWNQENKLPYNVIVGGESLIYMGEDADLFLTLKRQEDVVEIAKFLQEHELSEIIRNNYFKINNEEYYHTVSKEDLEYVLGWCGKVREFYENAVRENCHVIFSVYV